MKLIRNLKNINILPQLSLTIGNFDGIHLGHEEILKDVKAQANRLNISSAVLTFEPHPFNFFKPESRDNFRITSLAQKLKIFETHNIDFVIVLPFNQKFCDISAQDFIDEILVRSLKIKHLTIGHDFVFGKNRQGNFSLLTDNSKKSAFDLNEIKAFKKDDITCSSSIIRELIRNGDIAKANQLLNKNFTICGIVNQGRKLASKIEFPTANMIAKPQILQPKFGVYKTITTIPHLNKKFASITNFGIKPTINHNAAPLFETHIFNFSHDIYGKKIIVEFIDFIREEKKFSSINELQAQIKEDIRKIL